MNGKEERKLESALSMVFRKEIAILEIKQTNMIEKIDEIKDDISMAFKRADKAYNIATNNQTEIKNMKEAQKTYFTIAGLFFTALSIVVSWITSVFHRN